MCHTYMVYPLFLQKVKVYTVAILKASLLRQCPPWTAEIFLRNVDVVFLPIENFSPDSDTCISKAYYIAMHTISSMHILCRIIRNENKKILSKCHKEINNVIRTKKWPHTPEKMPLLWRANCESSFENANVRLDRKTKSSTCISDVY